MKQIDKIIALLEVRRSKDGWMAKCPAHDDKNPSLHVSERSDGGVLLNCFAGCSVESVVGAIGLTLRDLMPSDESGASQPARETRTSTTHKSFEAAAHAALRAVQRARDKSWRQVESHTYSNSGGQPIMRVLRFEPELGGAKEYRPISLHTDGWRIGDPVGPLPLFRLPLLAAGNGTVFVVEGERCAEVAGRIGLIATTSAHGANSAAKTDWSPLAGRDVVILPDNDEAGRRYESEVARLLCELDPPARVRAVALPDLGPGDDIVQFVESRRKQGQNEEGIRAEIESLVLKAPLWTAPATSDAGPTSASLSSMSSWASKLRRQPAPIGDDAFHGLAGDFVRVIAPHSEADPKALLVQFLAGVGNVIGRRACYRIEADSHYPVLFVVLVGDTSKARKGTSWGYVRRILEAVDPAWARTCQQSGLSSGEGLIWEVRDADTEARPKARKRSKKDAPPDPGVSDKRRLVYEGEFASTLRVFQREGSTLSAVLRNAWDNGTLQTMTKNSPARATDAHISVIAHITREEVVRYFDRTEMANGFGNRFLWVCVRRSKPLAFGGNVPQADLDQIADRLRQRVERARQLEAVEFDGEARTLWEDVYPTLSEGKAGLLGAVTARAETQVVRLAVLYAVLDEQQRICTVHLKAALALWRYCEDSARCVFGDAPGDPLADAILEALRAHPEGMDRTAIRDHFSRNRAGAELERALASLANAGLAWVERDTSSRRPREIWHATTETTFTTKVPA